MKTTNPAPVIFTHHTFRCQHCGRLARLSVECIETVRADFGDRDIDFARLVDFCLSCIERDDFTNEHVAETAVERAQRVLADAEGRMATASGHAVRRSQDVANDDERALWVETCRVLASMRVQHA